MLLSVWILLIVICLSALLGVGIISYRDYKMKKRIIESIREHGRKIDVRDL